MMRISIRTQLGSLFLLSSLVSVSVVSVALYLTLQQLTLVLRGQRLALTASLKATQVASALESMDDLVQIMSTRDFLRDGLTEYNAGDRSEGPLGNIRQAFSPDMAGTQQQALALQVQITAADGVPILNFTAQGALDPPMRLPYDSARNGSAVYLGDTRDGVPPSLYPNVTRAGIASDEEIFINGRKLDDTFGILFGPLHLNRTVTLFSISRSINDPGNGSTLGCITAVLNGKQINEAVQSHVGLARTGTSLVLSPFSSDNRFAPQDVVFGAPLTLAGTRLLRQGSELNDALVHRVLPTADSLIGPRQHRGPADAADAPPFKVGSDPTLKLALGRNLSTVNNAGSIVLHENQVGVGVSTGFALVNSSLCDWIYQVQYSDSEILSATQKLRNVALICIFSTIALMLCLYIPVTGLWSRPIIRLRNATSESIKPSSLRTISLKGSVDSLDSDIHSAHGAYPERDSAMKEAQSVSRGLRNNLSRGGSKSTSSVKKFRIPQQVKESRHLVEDELTDLTRVFNQMSDELEKQYTSMEERVKLRTYELEVSKKAAEAANESKSHFIANISHELKTPLNHILGMTQTCLQEESIAQIRESLTVIERSGELLNNHLTDLLTFSKNQAGKALQLDEKRFRLGDIAAQIRAIFNHQATAKGVNLRVAYVGPGSGREDTQGESKPGFESMKETIVWGDLFRILQVVINLVGNSLKFTPEGGSISLHIRQLQEITVLTPCVSITSSVHEDSWSKYANELPSEDDIETESTPPSFSCLVGFEFEVTDTGPGIQKSLQEQIFKPFVQGDAGLARKHGGTGLGLSICSQLAELMNGKITLESEVGRGSKFTLQVPLNVISEGRRNLKRQASVVTRDGSSTIESVLEHDQIAPELFVQTGMHLPGQRSASLATASAGNSSPSKTRLIGLTQPYFSSATPPLTPGEETVPELTSKGKQHLKVLVAEDNAVNQQVVLRMLRLEDIVDVQIAKDGQEALERVIESMAAKTPYDLVLMDVQMPRLDGRQSTKLIRQAGFTAPVIALTAFADEKNEKDCMEAGMDFFLEKPIKRDKLKRVLRRYGMDTGSIMSGVSGGTDKPVGSYFGSSA